jgi:ABC-type transport system involved in multi-copper enzyme maturation permease subunit
MVIHDRSYARWEGDRSGAVRAAPVIAEQGIKKGMATIFRRKLIAVVLTILAFGPFVAGLILMYARYYVLANIEEFPEVAEFFQFEEIRVMTTVNPEYLFFYMCQVQWVFMMVACLMVGAGLVAEDRRDNALELYLSRPVTLAQYLLGKFCAIAFYLAILSVVPATVGVLAQMSLSWNEPGELARLGKLLPRTLAAGAVWVAVPSLLILAASSLAKKARNAAISFVAFLFLLEGPVSNALTEILNQPHFMLLSFRHNLAKTVSFLLGHVDYLDPGDPGGVVAVWQSGVVLAGWCLLCLWLVRRRVQPVEIVA